MTPERIAELIPQALTGYYGHKCKDFNDNCICCQAWAELSRLTRERDEAIKAAIDEDRIAHLGELRVMKAELTSTIAGLRKLLEAKDCAVRASLFKEG